MRRDPRHSLKLALSLGTIYVVWGSSFLFTKIAVGALPGALFAAARFVSAGVLLALVARFWAGEAFPRRIADWWHATATGFFMVFASNGLNVWAMNYLPTNESALLNGTAAFWIAGLGVLGPRGHPLSRWAVAGLCVGFAGTALMLIPSGRQHPAATLAQLGVLVACLAWSLGTLYYRSVDTRIGPLMFMSVQMLMGGLMLSLVALLHGDLARWTWNLPGLVSLGYLTLISSCLAYAAYGWLTRHAAPAVIGTYGYVNPAIATFLGWRFRDERLTGVQLAGMVVIILGVGLLTLPTAGLANPETLKEPPSP